MDNSDYRISLGCHHQAAARNFDLFLPRYPFKAAYLIVAASTIASCVSELVHVTSKSSDEEKEKLLARIECPSRDLPLSWTDKCKIIVQ